MMMVIYSRSTNRREAKEQANWVAEQVLCSILSVINLVVYQRERSCNFGYKYCELQLTSHMMRPTVGLEGPAV